jgi:hypothetical protein
MGSMEEFWPCPDKRTEEFRSAYCPNLATPDRNTCPDTPAELAFPINQIDGVPCMSIIAKGNNLLRQMEPTSLRLWPFGLGLSQPVHGYCRPGGGIEQQGRDPSKCLGISRGL